MSNQYDLRIDQQPIQILPDLSGEEELRDWFAGLAMQTLISQLVPPGVIAEEAYKQADAMIHERDIK